MTGDRSSVPARARRAAPCLPACGMHSPPRTVRRHGGFTPPSRRRRGVLPSTPACHRMNASCCSPLARLSAAARACAMAAAMRRSWRHRPGLDCQVYTPPRLTQRGLLVCSPRRAQQPHEPLCARVADHDGGHHHKVTTIGVGTLKQTLSTLDECDDETAMATFAGGAPALESGFSGGRVMLLSRGPPGLGSPPWLRPPAAPGLPEDAMALLQKSAPNPARTSPIRRLKGA